MRKKSQLYALTVNIASRLDMLSTESGWSFSAFPEVSVFGTELEYP